MNDYEQKQERRRQRLIERAERKDAQAESARQRSDEITRHIPMGQPILVGHHSEKRHRRDLDRSDRAMRQSVEAAQEAEALRERAAAVGHGGLSSDDPDAIQKLQDQLGVLEAAHKRMVKANRLARRKNRTGLLELNFTEKQLDRILDSGEVPYAAYQLANSNASIRRIKARIVELPQRAAEAEAFEEIGGEGWRIFVEDNRVCIAFAERTSTELYSRLRSHGFTWSPTRNAFVRKFSTQAIYWAKQIVGSLA
jgi:hypothetical protein